MRRFAILLVASTALAACATRGASPGEVREQTATVATAAEGPVAPAGADRPQLGTFGFDEAGMDRSVAPGDNFYQFANGTWAKNTPIPADKSNYGMFTMLDDLSRQRTREILDEARADSASKIGNAYAAFLDEAAIDAKGLAPLQPWLNRIRGLGGKAGYPALVAEATRNSLRGPVVAFVGQDDKEPEQYALSLVQSGLGMPDRDYYLKPDPKLAETRAAYLAHLEKMLTLAGEANAAARAKALLDFETGIARAHWTRVDSRDATKTYNKMSVAQLAKLAPGFDFQAYFRGLGADVRDVVVAQPSAVTGIAALVARTPLPVLKDQLLVRSLDEYADVLPKAFDEEHFAFYGTVLSGTPQQEERWKRAVSFTTEALTDEVSKIYVQRYFPPETKAAADKLVRNVIAAMDRRIDQLEWMAPETKTAAHAKLASFTPKIGYPSQWRDFSGLEIRRDDALGNAMRAARFDYEYNVTKLGKPIYRWEWGMTPMEINAYANFGMVEIVFPAAILQPPFFDPKADPAVNYGGIGAVIGHELSHHFDDQGAKYNREGRLVDWWTPADVKNFGARLDALGAEYDAYEPLPGLHVQGKLTMGENVADLAGLTVAYDAWKASLGDETPKVIDGFTGDQRFYLGWAQVWRRNYREANLRQRLLTDPHSPSEQRAAVVRNLDPWYPAFGVQAGQRLYLPPAQRVRIW
ncbi:MAG: M13 family metallopeptidase [Alphaproteobacteria bacterium]|nr:M13 family metallopeptidase [Alphaproteobacteria bacterium]MBV9372484.1 M13 family metallopeptidase [Alphaproteobacteria bacterium]MBV9902159.1 M13 family metallopeptidase [Alphaproteobacteria bacterium]